MLISIRLENATNVRHALHHGSPDISALQHGWLQNIVTEYMVVTIPKRKQHVEEFLNALRLEANGHIHAAVLKDSIEQSVLKSAGTLSSHCRPLRNAEIACYLSHMQLYSKIVEYDYTSMMIFEDDVAIPSQDISSVFRIVCDDVAKADPNYDIIYFGRCWDLCEKESAVSKDVIRTFYPGCTHSYVVSLSGARKLLTYLGVIQDSLDRSIKKLAYNGMLRCYASKHNMFTQDRKNIASELGHEGEILYKCIDSKSEVA